MLHCPRGVDATQCFCQRCWPVFEQNADHRCRVGSLAGDLASLNEGFRRVDVKCRKRRAPVCNPEPHRSVYLKLITPNSPLSYWLGPAVRNSWLGLPFVPPPCPKANAQSSLMLMTLLDVSFSGPISFPVFALNALIHPLPNLQVQFHRVRDHPVCILVLNKNLRFCSSDTNSYLGGS